MKKKNILNLICGAACLLGLATSCSVDPDFYSQVVPDTFYSSQNAVWQRFSRPFTHWRWWVGHNDTRFALQELGTDEFIVPTRGSDWFDGATYQRFHHHEYTFDMTRVAEGFRLPTMGVALAWGALEDLMLSVSQVEHVNQCWHSKQLWLLPSTLMVWIYSVVCHCMSLLKKK